MGFLLRIIYIFYYRFNSDEPQHLHVAWGWAQGLVPYRDFFDNHTPLFHILFSFPVRWLGDRWDLLILMRLAMLPLYGLTLWGVYKIGKAVLSPRLGLWAAVLAGLFPPFFNGSVEFRTDDLWAMLFVLAIAITVSGRLTYLRVFLVGFVLGAAFSVSMKTSLLLACFLAAGVTTYGLCARTHPLPISIKRQAVCLVIFLGGLLLIPGAILAWFYSKGALGNLYYGIIQHNMLPGLGGNKGGLWHKIKFVPVACLLWLFARNVIVRRNLFKDLTPQYTFLFLMAGLYIAAISILWPLVTQQDFLPVQPLMIVLLIPLLNRPLPQLRSGSRTTVSNVHRLSPQISMIIFLALLELAVLAFMAPGIFPWMPSQNARPIAEWKAVLALTKPEETVMDPKGELIFRRRPFYWGLEKITRARMKRGLIQNTINEQLVQSRTCVIFSDLHRYPKPTQKFIQANYISVGPVLVAGQSLGKELLDSTQPISFKVRIPAQYAIVGPHGPGAGKLDGTAYQGSRLLAIGRHQYQANAGEGPLALV